MITALAANRSSLMSLLQALKLPVPKHFLPMAAGPAAQGDASDLRAQALRLQTAIEARRKQQADLLLQLQAAEPQLAKLAAAAKGDTKKQVAARQALVAKKKAEAERDLAEIEADLGTIGNAGAKREALVAVLARNGAGGKVAERVETTGLGLHSFNENPLKRDVTTTRTSYENGKATVEKRHETSKVDLHGVTSTQSKEKEVTSANLSVRTSEEKKTNVSVTGKVSIDRSTKTEVELPDGRKSSLENGRASEFSAKGASQTQTVKKVNFDGSGAATTVKNEFERGEGKATATSSSSVTNTSASGTGRTTDKKASGGLIAGKDGIGAGGSLAGGRKITSKGGRQAGVVAGLHANVVCNIGKPSGDPPMYAVKLTVSFGGSVAASGGLGQKEGAKASGSVEVKRSQENTMVVMHMLDEKALGTYTDALAEVSKGSKVAATGEEFAIIAAGVKQGWSVAREMYKPGGNAVTRKATDGLVKPGDAIKVTESKTGGISGKAGGKGVGVGYGVADTDTNSLDVKRNDKGGLDVDAESEHGRETNASASMEVLGMGVSVGSTNTHKTSFGYSITIDPKNDPDGKILEAYQRCRSRAQFALFIGMYKGKITVTGQTEGQSDAHSLSTGVSIAGVEVFSMGEGHGVDEKTKTDADGKLVGKTVVAHANIGGKLVGWADSKNDDAVAEIDGQGHGRVTLTTTLNDNHNSRSRDKRDKDFKEKLAGKGPQTGALTGLAGGEESDTATHDVSGLKLSNADLKRIGGVACRSLPAWIDLRRRVDEKEDLRKAGIEIAKAKGAPAVVAEQLTRFIGGDSVERLETVRRIARGGYHATMGSAFEFPDSIRRLQEDYDIVTDDELVGKVNAIGKKTPAQAKAICQEYVKTCDSLMSEIAACKDFDNTATRAEMVQRLELRRQKLAIAVKGFGGEKPVADPKQLAEDGVRLLRQCSNFYVDQSKLLAELYDLKGGDKMIPNSDRGDARKLIKKLEDLIYRWRGEWYLLKENYQAQGLPEGMLMMPTVLPDEKVVDYWDTACGN